jgi:hypothetical protein
MSIDDLSALVVGDVNVDWYFWPRDPVQEYEGVINWKIYKGLYLKDELAGAFVVYKLLSANHPNEIKRNQEWEDYDKNPEKYWKQLLHTNIELDHFPFSEKDQRKKVYRVSKFLGFTVPYAQTDQLNLDHNQLRVERKERKEEKDAEKINLVIIHDLGNGFRSSGFSEESGRWPEEIRENSNNKTIIIHYMNPPLFEGKLWNYVQKHHKDNVILIINAEDLRKKGVNISRSLSWEKTALEFLWGVTKDSKLNEIKDLSNVIVRFGLEGTIYYNGKDKNIKSKLYFDPHSIEGRLWNENKFGRMKGYSAVFISSLASKLILNLKEKDNISKAIENGINEGIEYGMFKSQEFMENGHGCIEKGKKPVAPEFFNEIGNRLFPHENEYSTYNKNPIQNVELPNVEYFNEPDPYFWRIMDQKAQATDSNSLGIAMDIVLKGSNALSVYPVGSFGNLTTVDRAETESFRSIMNIMTEYINSKKVLPLSIAVFGYPGSGKSFGIEQVAKSIDSERVEKIEFNVSQFSSLKDLTNAFHRIRDISLKGKIPLAFFDEFDCTFQNRPLGWLRSFLVPMQEGEFLDLGRLHPIGKSIFVFAGGVYNDFKEFCEFIGASSNSHKDSNQNQKLSPNILPPEKCLDFVSRLRGYVNILGPNKINHNDDAYIIRRAILLRSLIEQKIPDIITKICEPDTEYSTCTANIDENLLKFLLKVPVYKHGARSMQAIIDMSMVGKDKVWQKASLPSKEQLDLHIEGANYSDLFKFSHQK